MKYDLHVHTYYSHKCSGMSPEKAIDAARKRGLNGIAITDHNTIKGALEAKRINKDKNFKIIIGEEVSTDKGHVVCLNVKKEIKPNKRHLVIKEAKKQNCIIIAAHPFDYFRNNFKGTIPKDIDAIEVKNGRCSLPLFWWKAKAYAKKHNIPISGGSDSHFPIEVGRVFTEFYGNLKTAIKNHKTNAKGTNLYGYIGLFLTSAMQFLRFCRILKRPKRKS